MICNCELKNKVPQLELAWLKDQRSKIGTKGGKFIMSGVDKVEAKIYRDKVKREAKKALNEEIKRKKVEQEQLMNAEQLATEEFEIENIATVNEDNNNDSEFKAVLRPSRGQQSDHNQNRINLDFFIAEVVRYGWSDRAAAAAFNAALKSIGKITDGDDKLAVDKNKKVQGHFCCKTKTKAQIKS